MKLKIFIITLIINLSFLFSAENKITKEIIEKKYDIKIYTGKFIPSTYAKKFTTWDYLTDKDTDNTSKFLDLILSDFNIYPVDFIKKIRLKTIVLVKNIAVQGQKRSAMPDAYGNKNDSTKSEKTLYLDISILKNDNSENYIRYVLHHEFYHLIEANYFGDLYYKDPQWSALNNPGTIYGTGGINMRDPHISNKKHPNEGFLNGYCTSGIEEDKAEVFSYLMTKSLYKEAETYFEKDKILKSKFDYMKNFLNSKSSSFNENYFEKIHK